MSLFDLGQIMATPAAIEAMEEAGNAPSDFLPRHAKGDWGDVDPQDREWNNAEIAQGGRLLSAYTLNNGQRLWIITEAEDGDGKRAATTLLLPEDY